MVFFRRKLGLDLVPRVGPLAVNSTDVGIVALQNFHTSSDENTKNASVSCHIFMLQSCLNVLLNFNACRVEEHCAKRHRKRFLHIICIYACETLVIEYVRMQKFTSIYTMHIHHVNDKSLNVFWSELPKKAFQHTM